MTKSTMGDNATNSTPRPSERIEEIGRNKLREYKSDRELGSWPELEIWAIKEYLNEIHISNDKSIENAKHIIKCVKSHDALLEACKDVIKMMDTVKITKGLHFSETLRNQIEQAILQAEKE